MKVRDMKKIIKSTKFDDCECNFKLKGGHKITLEDVMNEIKSVKADVKSINDRIDNLVSKNNLKE